MRGRRALCAALAGMAVGAMFVPAAPIKPAGPVPVPAAASPTLHVESMQFAQTLNQLFALIENDYVRPVSRADMAEAAIRGLYDAVREPIPAELSHEIHRADEFQLIAQLTRVRESLGNHESLRGKGAMLIAMQALPRALDPYSGVTPLREQDPRVEGTGDLIGAGLEFAIAPVPPNVRGVVLDATPMIFDERVPARPAAPAGPIRVTNVIPGGPAQRAGMRPGDLVVKIEGLPPEAPAFQTALQGLQHVTNGVQFNANEMRVTVLREGAPAPLDFRFTRTRFHPESVFGVSRRPDGTWDYLLGPAERLGYIRLGQIGTNDNLVLQAAVKSLQDESVRGLLLDLRWCPGGYLMESATMARMFLSPELPIATQRSRSPTPQPVEHYAVEVTATDIPIVVLVNGETSGGGELIAAALQDHGRAVVAGQRTVGKGSVQLGLTNHGYPFKLTTGTFIRPNGKNFQRNPESKPGDDWGVRPDPERELPVTAELSKWLKHSYTLQALRPPGDLGALPTDDPEADPQRQAAVRMLRELVDKK
jgi:C-terminal peptidase prc